ncbi:MAG: lon, partial [Acidimicrobiales bacterium]|nr:lon [Acidimicrobiales bacterium]
MPESSTATALPVLPLTAGVVGPGMVVTVVLESPEATTAADAAEAAGRRLLLVPQVDGRTARVGVIAALEDAGAGRGGRRAVLLRGLERAVVGAGVPGEGPGLWVAAEPVDEPAEASEEVRRLATEYRAVVESILERRGAGRLAEALRGIADPGAIADTALYSPDLSLEKKVAVLEAVDVEERLRLVLGWARDTLAELSIREDIDRDVVEGLDKAQREAVLRRQMESIRKELGEGDEDLVGEYRRRLDESGAPEGVRAAVEKELVKLERTSGQSPEHGWIVSWLDALLELPWSRRADEVRDLRAVRAVLDADHSGLEDVKERIVEALAVRALRAERGVE